MAVLNAIASRSRVTAWIVLWTMRRWSDVASAGRTAGRSCIVSARSSTIIRQARSRKPRTPLTPSMLHGFTASSGPMNISYNRSASAPYSLTTWSGLTTLPRLFDILYARLSTCTSVSRIHTYRPSSFLTSSAGILTGVGVSPEGTVTTSPSGVVAKSFVQSLILRNSPFGLLYAVNSISPRIIPWLTSFWKGSGVLTWPRSKSTLCQKRA